MPHPRRSEREQLDLFRALPGDLAPRDHQDLMAYPFFSLAKSPRVRPIDFRMGKIAIRVEAVPEHGMATIWDADVLIWAASQIVEARDRGCRPSRLMAATPYEILTFVGRGTSARDYDRLKAALDRLQSTTVATSIRQPTERRMHRFSWINEWKERADAHGRPRRAGADPARLVLRRRARRGARPHHRRRLFRPDRRAGALALPPRAQAWRPPGGRLELRLPHLHAKSGALSPLKHFAFDLREIVRRQSLPGYRLEHRSTLGARAAELRAASRSTRSTAPRAARPHPSAWG